MEVQLFPALCYLLVCIYVHLEEFIFFICKLMMFFSFLSFILGDMNLCHQYAKYFMEILTCPSGIG